MARTADDIAVELGQIKPIGWAWPDNNPGDLVQPFWRPWAEELALLEAADDALLSETDPSRAVNLLPDYERVLGPDPCGRDQLATTDDQRRAIVYQRWTDGADICVQYFVDLAAKLGITVTIREFWVFEFGYATFGDDLAHHPQEFIWQVTLPTDFLIDFHFGTGQFGDVWFGDFAPSLVPCVIRDAAPLHTLPVFAYTTGS